MSEYDAVIYLSFWDGRGKEKLWVQILYRLSIIKLNFFSNPWFLTILLLP
jgi:hypothetical protein